jgi:hypothetical protein
MLLICPGRADPTYLTLRRGRRRGGRAGAAVRAFLRPAGGGDAVRSRLSRARPPAGRRAGCREPGRGGGRWLSLGVSLLDCEAGGGARSAGRARRGRVVSAAFGQGPAALARERLEPSRIRAPCHRRRREGAVSGSSVFGYYFRPLGKVNSFRSAFRILRAAYARKGAFPGGEIDPI